MEEKIMKNELQTTNDNQKVIEQDIFRLAVFFKYTYLDIAPIRYFSPWAWLDIIRKKKKYQIYLMITYLHIQLLTTSYVHKQGLLIIDGRNTRFCQLQLGEDFEL